jgi:hypothetical protein
MSSLRKDLLESGLQGFARRKLPFRRRRSFGSRYGQRLASKRYLSERIKKVRIIEKEA